MKSARRVWWERAQSASCKKRNASDWGRGSSKSKSPVTPNIIFTLIISHSLSYKVRRRFAIRPEIQSNQTNSHVAQICVTGHPFSQSKIRRIFFFFSKHFEWKLILFTSFRLDGQEQRFFKARRAGYESEYYGINNTRPHIVRKSKFSLGKFSSSQVTAIWKSWKFSPDVRSPDYRNTAAKRTSHDHKNLTSGQLFVSGLVYNPIA